MPTLPEESTNKASVVPVATLKSEEAEEPSEKTSKRAEGVEVPMPIRPVERIRILSAPAVPKIISPVEVAVRVSADSMVRAPDEVFQREAAAPVRFKALSAVISVEFIVMVPPKVPVAA